MEYFLGCNSGVIAMKKLTVLAAAIFVSGCAHYDFQPTNDMTHADLKTCQAQARATYFSDPVIRARMIGPVLASLSSDPPADDAKPYDMNVGVADCMHSKGYTGSIN